MSADSLLHEVEKSYEGEVGLVVAEFLQRQRDYSEDCDEYSLIAETAGGDFAGCISASSVLESAPHTAVLSMIFVTPRYRGLGVGRELTLQCLEKLRLQVAKDTDRDYWLNADEAKEYGLVGKIIKTRKDLK